MIFLTIYILVGSFMAIALVREAGELKVKDLLPIVITVTAWPAMLVLGFFNFLEIEREKILWKKK